MTQITIVMDGLHFDVVDEAGRCCDGLSWDEMIGQVVMLTIPPQMVGRGYQMKTPDEWRAFYARRFEQISTKENDSE